MSVCNEWAGVKVVCMTRGEGGIVNFNRPSKSLFPASLLCIFNPTLFFFCYFLICDSSWYLQALLYGNETGSWFPPNTVMVGVPFASQPKTVLCLNLQTCTILYSTNCNSAVGSYRKEAGCIVTLTSWCNAPWSCSQIHGFKVVRDLFKLSF